MALVTDTYDYSTLTIGTGPRRLRLSTYSHMKSSLLGIRLDPYNIIPAQLLVYLEPVLIHDAS